MISGFRITYTYHTVGQIHATIGLVVLFEQVNILKTGALEFRDILNVEDNTAENKLNGGGGGVINR